MRHVLCVLIVFGFSSTAANASDPVGIYAIIDRVVLEPDEESPERAQIWGVFALSGAGLGGTGPYESSSGGFYEEPQRGYMYYSIQTGRERVTRIEWADMNRVAGTRQCIAFGSRYRPKGRVRSRHERPELPDSHPTATGIQKISRDTNNPPPRAVLTLPSPISPEDGGWVEPGEVTLVIWNARYVEVSGAAYFFEIENSSGNKEKSPELSGGKWQTQWSPAMMVKKGEEYTWRAWTVEGDYTSPVLTATFTSSFRRGDVNGDDVVDIADAVAILMFLFLGETPPQPRVAGDTDGSGVVDVSDAIYLLTYLFLGGPPPPPPFSREEQEAPPQ